METTLMKLLCDISYSVSSVGITVRIHKVNIENGDATFVIKDIEKFKKK